MALKINLFLIFGLLLIAIFVRLIYFPENVYFSFDQARDSFTSLELMKGDLKIIGPPSAASDQLFPGPVIYYLHGPVLAVSGGNPEALSLFLRLFNASGVILVFFIGLIIFNRWIGALAGLFYAISYEQTQYTLFLCHQGYAPVAVLIYYLGLSLLLFKNNPKGLLLAALGFGLSIQFHYSYGLLIIGLIAIIIFWRKQILTIPKKYFLYSALIFLATISTFIITEIKFNFKFSFFVLSSIFSSAKTTGQNFIHLQDTFFITNRFLHDTFLANYAFTFIVAILLLLITLYLLSQKNLMLKGIFLIIWFLGALPTYFLSGVDSYYYSGAASVSLLLIASFAFYQLLTHKYIFLGIIIIAGILFNNLFLITTENIKGPNRYVVIQPELLLGTEKKALDYIYNSSQGKPFSISAVTIPLNVNTLWSYLFEWYGKDKYGYVPIWGSEAAPGFPGNLKVVTAKSELPEVQYLIIEPTNGIRQNYLDKIFREESYFTKLTEEKKFGTIVVQKRQKY